MASECEDEGIVIEESLRESFFDYIDQICDVIFTNIFGSLSMNLLKAGNSNQQSIVRLKDELCQAFHKWVFLRVPDECIVNLVNGNQSILQLIFSEVMVTEQMNEENVEHATDCII